MKFASRFGLGPARWAAVAVSLIFGRSLADAASVTAQVNVFIGTAVAEHGPAGMGYYIGNTFPGAAFPMGMVQWSPDTPGSRSVKSGYSYTDRVITGFPLTHFSGRGVTYLQDFPFMPTTKTVKSSPGTHWGEYAAPFEHRNEVAHPGYYSVVLDDGIHVELTVTARTGFGRIGFPAHAHRAVLVRTDSKIDVIGKNKLTGYHLTTIGGGKRPYTLYFVAEFDRPFSSVETWTENRLQPGQRSAQGKQCGGLLSFDDEASDTVQMKVGLSFVSIEGAQANLSSENPGWDFTAVREGVDRAWAQMLERIQVDGGTPANTHSFYTALYHCFFHPNVLSDADGKYPGMDGQVHAVQKGHEQYQNIPAWDQYRSFAALRAILTPRESADVVQSLVNYARQDAEARPSGGGLPRWEQANRNSGGMVGDGDDAIIATAYAFGARDFDTVNALAAMEKGASVPGTTSDGVLVRQGLEDYLSLGYVPERASVTEEYCIADFALGQFAHALGQEAKSKLYLNRSENWRKLYNPATGYLLPRERDGSFKADFTPATTTGYTEGSVAQYLWMVNFDFQGLFRLLGGNEKVVARLDDFFTSLNGPGGSAHAYMGNEPGEATPWAYDFAGAPYRTQAVVQRIQRELFLDLPGGLPGNDDAGAISSWYVLSAIGLYPAIPGVAGFAVGTPLFPTATVLLANGHVIHIEAGNASGDSHFVQSLSIDGMPWNSPWIPWTRLSLGAGLRFKLGDKPSQWGTALGDSPPSFSERGD